MSEPKKNTRPKPNRLARFINVSDGIKTPDALFVAETKLGFIRERSLVAIDEFIASIGEKLQATEDTATKEQRREIYNIANSIYGTAGTFGLEVLGLSALSMCELIDYLDMRDSWNQKAAKLHFEGMRLLRSNESLSRNQQEGMLEGLRDVVRRMIEANAAANKKKPKSAAKIETTPAPTKSTQAVDHSEVLSALGSELSRLTASGKALEQIVSQRIKAGELEGSALIDAQGADFLVQHLSELAKFIDVYSSAISSGDSQPFDQALGAITLGALAQRLSTGRLADGESGVQPTEEIEFF